MAFVSDSFIGPTKIYMGRKIDIVEDQNWSLLLFYHDGHVDLVFRKMYVTSMFPNSPPPHSFLSLMLIKIHIFENVFDHFLCELYFFNPRKNWLITIVSHDEYGGMKLSQ